MDGYHCRHRHQRRPQPAVGGGGTGIGRTGRLPIPRRLIEHASTAFIVTHAFTQDEIASAEKPSEWSLQRARGTTVCAPPAEAHFSLRRRPWLVQASNSHPGTVVPSSLSPVFVAPTTSNKHNHQPIPLRSVRCSLGRHPKQSEPYAGPGQRRLHRQTAIKS